MFRSILRRFVPVDTLGQKAHKQLLSIQLGKDDIAIDCGANVGSITEYLCKSGATVYSFEPNPYAFEILKSKFSTIPNVHCRQEGVSNANNKMKLYLHENSDEDEVHWSTGSSLLDFKDNVRTDKFVEVQIIDLSDFINSLEQRVRILKMDVEGAECGILMKLIESDVINKIDHVFVETHDHKIPELKAETDEIRELIEKRGIQNINLDWT